MQWAFEAAMQHGVTLGVQLRHAEPNIGLPSVLLYDAAMKLDDATIRAIIERSLKRSNKANKALKRARNGDDSKANYKKAAKLWKENENDLAKLLKALSTIAKAVAD